MQIGIISDIHGDMPSLLAAAGRLQEAAVDFIVCAGDVVERGSDDHGVIEYLRQHDIPTVQGNHDENAIRHAEFSIDTLAAADPAGETPLCVEAIDYLKGLPATQFIKLELATILMAHATPSNNGAPVFQDSSCESLAKKFKKDLARMDGNILIVGHTHFPFDIRYKGKRVLNPGSVCNLQPRDSHTCGILNLTDQTFRVLDLATGHSIDFLNEEFT